MADWLIADWLIVHLCLDDRQIDYWRCKKPHPIVNQQIANQPIDNRQSANRQSAICNRK
jgi:hypothetical protein